MQPYFIPYAGYFRLFTAADVVVMFDCVQFPRRGWVHRNRLRTAAGADDWLTLPVAKAPQDVLIRDLHFAPQARERLREAARRFPLLEAALQARHPLAERVLRCDGDDVAAYLVDLLREFAALLGYQRPVVRSSTLPIPPELRAQDRVIAILQAVGATRYVNPPGGRELYDHPTFERNGLSLRFLTPYGGSMESILARVLGDPLDALAREIERETVLAA